MFPLIPSSLFSGHVTLAVVTGTIILMRYLWVKSLNSFEDRASVDEIYEWNKLQIDGLVQERRNSIANALELRIFCTNPSKWGAETWVQARVAG